MFSEVISLDIFERFFLLYKNIYITLLNSSFQSVKWQHGNIHIPGKKNT